MATKKRVARPRATDEGQGKSGGATVVIDNAPLTEDEKRELGEERAVAGGNLQKSEPTELASERKVRLMLESNAPQAKRHPTIRGGICDFHGILNPKEPSYMQYLLCPHYKDLAEVETVPGYKGIRCSYCPQELSPSRLIDILAHRIFNVYELLERPGELIVVCDDLNCRDKHYKRFTKNA